MSIEPAAGHKVGIGARTLYGWQRLRPEFVPAVQEGRHRAMLFWQSLASAWHHDITKTEVTSGDGG
ncbi:MAG: hypothetical protein EBS91_10230 [Betaproteobacteria bacterium]|nr:hypothetical protein [Betaproteobacteria bacterium]